MLKSLIKRSITHFEKKTNYDSTYMKVMADSSVTLAMMFSKFVKLNQYRKKTPIEVMHIARIAAFKSEDCGPCLQLSVNFALWSGMQKEVVKNAVLSPDKLSHDLKLVHDFSYKVATNAPEAEELRQKIEMKYGRDVTIELAIAIATCRVYPAVKRGMGFAKSCSIMNFDFGESN